MEKHFTGVLRKSLIVNTRWLLHACIVSAVGVGLVSCTKEQRDEGMIQPSELSKSLSSCKPAGVSATATPELCVIVTNVELFSHEPKADIGMSLMNRTGRRLFITLIETTSLTDSSGRKWNTGDSKGFGGFNNPLLLEPDGDVQGAISFHQNGQASADPTFSLRGEIGIMKTDSRGQAVPGQIAIRRGINLSGISVRRQTSQAKGPTEQNRDAKHTPLSARRANTASPKASASSKSSAPGAAVEALSTNENSNRQRPGLPDAGRSPGPKTSLIGSPVADVAINKSRPKSTRSVGSGPDVIGLRIGLTPDQARKVFKSNGFGVSTKSSNRPFDSYAERANTLSISLPGQAPRPVPNTKYIAMISGAIREVRDPATESSGSILSVFFGPVPGQEEIVLLNRAEYISASKKPTLATFAKTLVEKYGPPTEVLPDASGVYRWRYDNTGTLLKPSLATSFDGCPRLRPGAVGFQRQGSPQVIQEYQQSVPRCGATFLEVVVGFEGFHYAGPETRIKDYTTHMTGLDAARRALEAAQGIVDKAHTETVAAATKKEQALKRSCPVWRAIDLSKVTTDRRRVAAFPTQSRLSQRNVVRFPGPLVH